MGQTGKAYRRTTEVVKDTLTTLLDTCFVLARIRLDPGNVDTYTPSVHLLECAVTAVNGTTTVLNPSDSANFLRCISGAYHNLGGTLYKANRYGGATRFLRQGCDVGSRALQLHAGRHDDKEASEEAHAREEESERNKEGWKQLEEQLFRRYELLGVCYSKIGDRKVRSIHVIFIKHF